MDTADEEYESTNVYRVVWVPGTDRLRGECHCGAEKEAQDPIEVWAWLLAHPDGHGGGRAGAVRTETSLAGRRSERSAPVGV
ncbi:hypothetical protein [Actinomadura alba]|uniref:Uncharacterized protein n=1 Tax=Actinomadura alba TaxID=406431 RepID=A0ABR7LTX7_9ACTN|nr:hypothetical protein [Actinomadura alba]MBC6468307.1 hypothetical protein [Actinomadura alba]